MPRPQNCQAILCNHTKPIVSRAKTTQYEEPVLCLAKTIIIKLTDALTDGVNNLVNPDALSDINIQAMISIDGVLCDVLSMTTPAKLYSYE